MLGVDVAQTSRWANGESVPDADHAHVLLDVDYVLSHALMVWATPDVARDWLTTPNAHLDGITPIRWIKMHGTAEVVDALRAEAEGAYACRWSSRVFPYDAAAKARDAGHPMFVPPQGHGRWDNPDLYQAMYVASSPAGAIGERFVSLSHWSLDMLLDPVRPGLERSLAVYRFDEETHPLLDLDNPAELSRRELRPTDVVKHNGPRTQDLAATIFNERRWAGLSWWSMHRPQWTLHVLWDLDALELHHVEALPGNVGMIEAGELLGKDIDDDVR